MKPITRATIIGAVLGALAAWALTGASDAAMSAASAASGFVFGGLSACLVGFLIARFHTLGYVSAAALFMVMMLLTAWLATGTEQIATAAAIAVLVPVYLVGVVVAAVLVRPVHKDRR